MTVDRNLKITLTLLAILLGLAFGIGPIARAGDGARGEGGANLNYVANIVAIRGSLEVKRVTSPRWAAGRLNMPNYLKDTLKTDAGSVACIEFLNGSKVAINRATTMEIISSSAARDITRRPIVSGLILRTGAIWGNITGTGEENLKVETQSGVLGIRGTEFVLESDNPEEARLTVLKGEVEFQSASGTYSAVPGDVVDFIKGEERSREHNADLAALRDSLNLRFPGLNPVEQSIITVFAGRLLGPAANTALAQARELLVFVEDPGRYAQDYAIGEAQSHIPIPISLGGIFGSGSSNVNHPADNAPTALQPCEATITSYTPTFSWKGFSAAKQYRIIVSRHPISREVEDPGYIWSQVTSGESIQYPQDAPLLYPQTTYHWVVVALNDKDKPIGKPSTDTTFTMGSTEQLGMKLFYPQERITVRPEVVCFEWAGIVGCSNYEVAIGENPDLSSGTTSRMTTASFLELEDAAAVLVPGRTYYWQVKALNEDGTPLGVSSNPLSFILE